MSDSKSNKTLASANRSAKIRSAKHRLYSYPLPTLWLRIFKTAVIVLQGIISGCSVVSCIMSVVSSNSDEVKKALQSDVIDTVLPLFNVYNIVMAVLLAAVVVLCVVTYRKMSELTAESYRWLKLFIIFTSCINAVSTAAGELFRYFIFINTEYKVDVSNILFAAFAVVLMVFWMILNLRYFKKRKDLFAD